MGASGLGGGGRRSVNAELNLVPYIDLLSTLICFLLITAVWGQIDAMSTNAQSPSDQAANTPPDLNRVDLSVNLLTDRLEAQAGVSKVTIMHLSGQPDYISLTRVLEEWKNRWPQRKDVTLHSDGQAPYKFLIGLMDTLTEAQFEDVGVNTN
jgi:biopolymer transport protein ExbD